MNRRLSRTVRTSLRTLALPGLVLLIALVTAAPASAPTGITWPMPTSANETITVAQGEYYGYMTVLSTNERVVYDVRVTSGSNIDFYILGQVGFGLYVGDQSFQRLVQVEDTQTAAGEYTTVGQIFLVVDNADLSGATPTGSVTVSVNLQRTSLPATSLMSPFLWMGIGLLIAIVVVVVVVALALSRKKKGAPQPPQQAAPPAYGQPQYGQQYGQAYGQYPPQAPPPSGPYPPNP